VAGRAHRAVDGEAFRDRGRWRRRWSVAFNSARTTNGPATPQKRDGSLAQLPLSSINQECEAGRPKAVARGRSSLVRAISAVLAQRGSVAV